MRQFMLSLCLLASILFVPFNRSYADSILLDESFGNNGNIITSFGNDAFVSKLLIQPDGKKVVSGFFSNGDDNDWVVSRYSAEGILDADFGVNGFIKEDFFGNDSLNSLVLQPDGKIIVGGTSSPTALANYYWTLGRYNADGIRDLTFGVNGIVSINTRGFINDLLVQQDNKIIAVGYQSLSGDKVALVRYNPNGTLDTSFGSGGQVIVSVGSINARANDAVLQPDGKILVLGDFDASGHDEIFIARFNSNGSLDTAFGIGGISKKRVGFSAGGRSVSLQTDGKIVVTGGSVNNNLGDTYIARFNSNGTLDTSFGAIGVVQVSFSSSHDSSNSIVIYPDGKLLIGGSHDSGSVSGLNFAIRRFDADGELDNTFNGNGSLIFPFGEDGDSVSSISLQSDGKIVAAGNVNVGDHLEWGIARFEKVEDFGDFKQTDPDWSTTPPYDSNNIILSTRLDHSDKCGDMYGYGCAVTSVADVLYSYGETILSNNETLDPGSLNDWLSDANKGFQNCSIYWNVASAAVEIGEPEIINRHGNSNWTTGIQKIDDALSSGDLPILGIETVVDDKKGTHFLVVNEKLPDINGRPDYKLIDPALYPFVENDPGNTGKSLSEVYGGFDKVYKAIIYKKGSSPKNTLSIGGHSPIQLLITDPFGNTTGYDNTTDEIIENIPNSSYGIEPGIIPVNGSAPASSAKKYFQISNPIEGEYTVYVIGTGNGEYTLGFARTNEQSNVSMQSIEGITVEGLIETYQIHYNHNTSEPITIERVVTFDSLIADVNSLFEIGEISNEGIYNSLLAKANAALLTSAINSVASKNILNALEKELEAQAGKKLSQTAYEILSKDIQSLILTLE